MPLPQRNKDEDAKKFVNRCMSSDKMKKEFPDPDQRVAVCTNQSRAGATGDILKLANEEVIYSEIAKESSEAGFKYQDPVTGEIYEFVRKGVYRKNGRVLIPVMATETSEENT